MILLIAYLLIAYSLIAYLIGLPVIGLPVIDEEKEPAAAAKQKKVYKAHKQKMKDVIPGFKIHNLDSDSSSEEEQTDA